MNEEGRCLIKNGFKVARDFLCLVLFRGSGAHRLPILADSLSWRRRKL